MPTQLINKPALHFAPGVIIHPAKLLCLLEQYSKDVKIISLDCFDTLIWRKTAAPIDVFYDLQHRPAFQALELSAELRIKAESKARQAKKFTQGHSEVQLEDIYYAFFPKLTPVQIDALIEDELAAETAACYAFPPILEFIRAAHACGLKIIIVSDTYFTQPQMRLLLKAILPLDVISAISDIFCSSEWKRSKSNGLFESVICELGEPLESILHIGDHPVADVEGAKQYGILAFQLSHYDRHLAELLRMQVLSATFMDSSIRNTRSLASPFNGVLAAAEFSSDKAEGLLGYATLGPLMYSFAHFIQEKIEQLSQQGKNPKVIFLMRDANLPFSACEAFLGKKIGARIYISRFSALAASFRSSETVNNYLMDIVKTMRFADACRQLLLPDEIVKFILASVHDSNDPQNTFIELIQQTSTLTIIFKRSREYYFRLKKYLEKEVALEKGDTLLFIDLGYSGTAQRELAPVFQEDMDVEIIGCYLIALRTPGWRASRSGLLDPSWCDDNAMHMLVSYIALLEQLCTSSDKSVIDYDEDGKPIFLDSTISSQQYERLQLIQNECVRFIKDAKRFFQTTSSVFTHFMFREVARAALCRLLFFQTESELKYLQTFNFDLNLGTQEVLPLFNLEKGLTGLRRRGLLFMEKDLRSMRTNYPAELRSAGLELTLTLMLAHRLGLNLRMKDFSFRKETVRIIATRGQDKFVADLDAAPTYDGFFSLIVPVCQGDFQVQLLLGRRYSWVQIECIQYIHAAALLKNMESRYTRNAWDTVVLHDVNDKGNGLSEYLTTESSLFIKPPQEMADENIVVRVVFRPLALRGQSDAKF